MLLPFLFCFCTNIIGNMKVAIIGKQGAGKSLLFDLLAKGHEGKSRGYISGIGIAEIDDPRLEEIQKIVKPKTVRKARIEIYDFDGFGKLWKEEKAGEIMNELLGFDLLLQVVADFPPYDPVSEFEDLDLRLVLADLAIVQNKLKRLEKEYKAGKASKEEFEFFKKLEEHLGNEEVLSQIELTEGERKLIQGYSFMTAMPRVVVVNSSENRIQEELDPSFVEKIQKRGYPLYRTILPIEKEVRELPEEERGEILESYGLHSGFLKELKLGILDALGYITFFTTANDELRAWPIPKGISAKEAAGCIHTDMEKGFIKAEVLNYKELIEAGSLKTAKEKGLVRLEGKDYVVQDGDILYIKFSR